MKKLALFKAAFEYAYTSATVTDAFALAQTSLEAFKAAEGNSADFTIWNSAVQQYRQVLSQIKNQKLPSENITPVPAPTAPLPQTPESKA